MRCVVECKCVQQCTKKEIPLPEVETRIPPYNGPKVFASICIDGEKPQGQRVENRGFKVGKQPIEL